MVEILVKHAKKISFEELSEEDKAVIESRKILEENYDFSKDKEFVNHSYDYLCLNFKDIAEMFRLDSEHTQILKYNNVTWIVKMRYDDFKSLYTRVTGTMIMTPEIL
jgi:hypothetical protein